MDEICAHRVLQRGAIVYGSAQLPESRIHWIAEIARSGPIYMKPADTPNWNGCEGGNTHQVAPIRINNRTAAYVVLRHGDSCSAVDVGVDAPQTEGDSTAVRVVSKRCVQRHSSDISTDQAQKSNRTYVILKVCLNTLRAVPVSLWPQAVPGLWSTNEELGTNPITGFFFSTRSVV